MTTRTCYTDASGILCDYQTGKELRPATEAEIAASDAAGPTGAFACAGGVSTEQLDALWQEAAQAGDYEQVLLCEAAREGSDAALAECARVIANAEAQE